MADTHNWWTDSVRGDWWTGSVRGATQATAAATTAWTRSLTLALDAATGVNRALATAVGDGESDAGDVVDASIPSVAYERTDWSVERSTDDRAALDVGHYVQFTKRLSEADVRAFAAASGDTNRLHLDESYAGGTRFGGRIAHGVLVAGLVSAALARLPGTVVYLPQDLEFQRPVEIGEALTADCEIVEALGGDRFRVATAVENEAGEVVLDGDATVLVDE